MSWLQWTADKLELGDRTLVVYRLVALALALEAFGVVELMLALEARSDKSFLLGLPTLRFMVLVLQK